MRLDAADQAFVRTLMPEGAKPVGIFAVVAWIDPETGAVHNRWWHEHDLSDVTMVGIVEMAKAGLVNTILMDAHPEPDDDD